MTAPKRLGGVRYLADPADFETARSQASDQEFYSTPPTAPIAPSTTPTPAPFRAGGRRGSGPGRAVN